MKTAFEKKATEEMFLTRQCKKDLFLCLAGAAFFI